MSEADTVGWDSGTRSDPIADIRRAVEGQRQRALAEERAVAWNNARLAALSSHATKHMAGLSEEQRRAPLSGKSVLLADEHGVLPQAAITPFGEQIVTSMRVPVEIARFLGATIRQDVATLRLGVEAPR